MQTVRNDSTCTDVKTRWYFADKDYLVHDTPKGKRLTLRNGHKDTKVINRIIKMCGMRKVGPLKEKRYYELEVRV